MQVTDSRILALTVLLCHSAAWAQENRGSTADTIVVGGKIITMDSIDSLAEAIAIRDGKITGVGSTESMMKQAGRTTRIIDLHGRTATPGLIDSHLHFATVDPVYSINLSKVHSMEEVLQGVRARVAKAKPGEWIQGQGWDEGKLAERRYIYAYDLDQVAPQNPVWLVHTTGHYGVANSAALRLAQITANTLNPKAGTIDRDGKDQPSGVLKEEAAMRLVTKLIPAYSHQQMHDGYLTTMSELNKEGITAIKDPGIEAENWGIYRELHDEKKLSIHLFVLWRGGTTLSRTKEVLARMSGIPASKDDLLISGGVKLFMDGSGGARTAWMTTDWNKGLTGIDSGNRGYPLTDPQIYRLQVSAIHAAGIHVGTHAIGDRAIDWVVDTYAEVLKDKSTPGLRHSITHANIPSDHAIETMALLQRKYDAGYPEAQAEFMYWIGDTYAGNFGLARNLRLMPFQTYLRQGVRWAGGSDYPVTPFPARLGIWASVVRETLNGTYGKQPFGTSEAVDARTALRSYTAWAAPQLFLEKRIGTIEPGKDADIAIWDRDPYTVAPEGLKDMQCKMTLFQGRVVYQDQDF